MRSIKNRGRHLSGIASSFVLAVSLCGCGGGGGSNDASGANRVAVTGVATDGCVTKAFQPNYVSESDPHTGRANAFRQWKVMPLRVCFAPGILWTQARQSAVQAGFDWWAQATGGEIAYVLVTDTAAADITVTFEQSGETEYGALTTFAYDSANHLTQASIAFNVSYIVRDSLLTPAAAHEFGHALGIDGHSTQPTDVMAYSASVYGLQNLSIRDINTMKTNYACSGAARSVSADPRRPAVRSITIYD